MSRAVITGVGVVSAFGIGAGVFLDALAAGDKAVGPIRSFDVSTFPVKVAGEVPVTTIDAAWVRAGLSRTSSSELAASGAIDHLARDGWFRDRKVAFGLLAAAEALHDAGALAFADEAWLVVALGLERGFLEDLAHIFHDGAVDLSRGRAAALPPVQIRSSVDLAASAIASVLGLGGPVVVNASACAAGGLAVAHAASLIERGTTTVALVGGADSMINPMATGAFYRLGATSPRNAPDACRPFDRRRDGLVIGEGAAMFVVEAEERARARGKRPLARIAGWASTADAYRATAPRPDGAAASRAMRRALARAGLAPEAVGYVNAHGTGTPLNDPVEARAIRDALGAHGARVPVSSIKGAIGHLMAASGAIELAACLLPLGRGVMPGTANLLDLDPECEIEAISEAPRAADVRVALSNSFGFGGQNVTLILERAG